MRKSGMKPQNKLSLKTILFAAPTIGAFVAFSSLAALPARAVESGPSLTALEMLETAGRSPYEEVRPGDADYERARMLAEKGLLGFPSEVFLNGQPITRLELAQLTSIMYGNYVRWRKTGTVTTMAPVDVIEKLDSKERTTLQELQAVSEAKLENFVSRPAAPSGESLHRKGPILMKEDGAEEEAEEMVPVEVAVDLKMEDFKNLEELVNDLKKDLRDLDKTFKKELGTLNKVAMRNQRDIEKLEEENERLNIHGSMTGLFSSGQWEEDDPDANLGSGADNPYNNDLPPGVDFASRLELNISSKPKKFEDLKVGASVSAVNIFGGDRQRTGLFNGTRSALQVDELYVAYQNTKERADAAGGEPNIKLRNFRFGDIGVAYSPLTVFGKNMEGVSGTLQVKDYGLDFFGARTQYRPRNKFLASGILGDYDTFFGPDNRPKFSTLGDLNNDFKLVQYDQYMYGASMQTSLFDVPESLARISKIYLFDDKRSNRNSYGNSFYPTDQGSCAWGQWADLDTSLDPYREDFSSSSSDDDNLPLFCLPPEKNSILSAFLRHPIPGTDKKMFITAEYAHSTYFKPGYKASFPDRNGGSFNTVDTGNPAEEFQKWMNVRERQEQDDAYLALLDYNMGHSKIFPIGYVHLGPKFFTKNPGLPGFDTSGFDIGFLPINIQALDLYLASYSYDNPKSDIKYNFLYLFGKENDPQYFDPGNLMPLLSTRNSMETELPIIAPLIDRLNNRTSKLELNVLNAGATYDVSDDISLGYGYTGVTAYLPPSCIDANRVTIKDEQGETVDVFMGNGRAACADPADGGEAEDLLVRLKFKLRTSNYKLFWDTSSKGKYSALLSTNDARLDLKLEQQADPIVKDIVPQGKYYTLDQLFNYQLTGSTSLEFRWQKIWDRPKDNYYLNRQYDYNGYKFLVQTAF